MSLGFARHLVSNCRFGSVGEYHLGPLAHFAIYRSHQGMAGSHNNSLDLQSLLYALFFGSAVDVR
jgi:hypothetical protein